MKSIGSERKEKKKARNLWLRVIKTFDSDVGGGRQKRSKRLPGGKNLLNLDVLDLEIGAGWREVITGEGGEVSNLSSSPDIFLCDAANFRWSVSLAVFWGDPQVVVQYFPL